MVAYLFQFADKIIWALISLLWSGYEDPSPYLAMVSFGYFTSIASLGSNITLPTRILKTNEESVARTGTIKYLNLINYLHIIFCFIILISSLLILKIEFLISFLISLVLLLRSISSILESISVGLARYELSCIKRIYILPITFLAVIFAFINLKSE
ncbi:hypothetical protein OA254_02875, partial [Prochlorococcus sp. AH-716-P05]|nr:hypothetical protein [Prochlorococcus sp. AH-716-P05]